MKAKRTLIIINPISGTRNKDFVVNLIDRHLSQEEFDYGIVYTEGPGHATELAKAAADDGFDLVIAAGGDGTVHETAVGLIHSHTALGIIPVGSGNGLGRHLHIPTHVAKAIKLLSDCASTKIDVCTANGHPFFNVAGVGYDAKIARKFAKLPTRGFKSYISSVLKEWRSYKPKKYKLITNDLEIKKRAFLISIANGSQFGNNAWIAPNAKLNDGLMDICILKEFNVLAVPMLAYQLFNKAIDESAYTESLKTDSLIIKQKSKRAHLDGEPYKLGKTIEFKVLPKALNIFAPKDFLDELNSEYTVHRPS